MISGTHKGLVATLVLASAVLAGGRPALAQNQTRTQQETQTQTQTQQRIYGSQLMTRQERAAYRARMRDARTAQERERIRTEHHREMDQRARQRGMRLPDMPPAGGAGMGRGIGGGMGGGMGGGGGGSGGGGGGGGGGR